MEKKSFKRITTRTLHEMKKMNEKISMLTAYDYTFSKILDEANIDIILVGDSASNVFAGNETTVPITLDEMIYHAKSVVKGVKRALVVVDMPFGTYQSNPDKALKSAIRIMKESGAHAVKLEGGKEVSESISKIINAGIPVMGHLGLTPQSYLNLGLRKQGESLESQEKIKKEASILENLGCFSIVLEHIPELLAKEIQNNIAIPTIGIGAGNYCDGQVRVTADLLGLNDDQPPFCQPIIQGKKLFKDKLKEWVASERLN